MRERGHEVHYTTVAALLRSLGYSLHSNRETLEGSQHPDRDAQFRHIDDRVGAAIAAGEPAISIDTKKKELVGEFKNAGREWRRQGPARQDAEPRLRQRRQGQGDPVRGP